MNGKLLALVSVKKGENMQHQYIIDKYRIDLYFIDYKLAIECDENSHQFNKINDDNRQFYIEELLDCKFIRYCPQKDELSVAKVINKIHLFIKNFVATK